MAEPAAKSGAATGAEHSAASATVDALTGPNIVAALRSLGVEAGDLLVAHTAFKPFGPVAGGPATVARALVDTVSPGGTAFVPNFNFGQLAYDPASTKSLAGSISESFRLLPDAVRSHHPTHPVAGIGPRAAELLAAHDRTEPFGSGSPYWRLWENNAWVLLQGCDHRANAIMHVADEQENVVYLSDYRKGKVLDPQTGEVTELRVRRPSCSDGFQKIEPLMEGKVIRGKIGQSPVLLMRARDIVEATAQMLRRDQMSLLCDLETCDRCHLHRRMINNYLADPNVDQVLEYGELIVRGTRQP